jgi:hypothetical protein
LLPRQGAEKAMTNIVPGTLSLNEAQIGERKFCTASRPLMIGAKSARAAVEKPYSIPCQIQGYGAK